MSLYCLSKQELRANDGGSSCLSVYFLSFIYIRIFNSLFSNFKPYDIL